MDARMDTVTPTSTQDTISEATTQPQIKSRERVRDLAEVFTNQREVQAMLEFVSEKFEAVDSTFLEPACGNGNFLVEILRRKLALLSEQQQGATENWFEVAVLRAVTSIYAVDISYENVVEARARMTGIVSSEFDRLGRMPTSGFESALATALDVNVICGDTLNAASEISFFEWQVVEGDCFVRTPFQLEEPEYDLFFVAPKPLAPIHYADLGHGVDQ